MLKVQARSIFKIAPDSPVQTLLGGHGPGEHVEADGARQLRLERLRRHRDLCVVCDGLLRCPMQLVETQVPRPLRRVQRRHPRRLRSRCRSRGGVSRDCAEFEFAILQFLYLCLPECLLCCGYSCLLKVIDRSSGKMWHGFC